MIYKVGNKSKAICDKDGLVETTFLKRDVSLSDGSGEIKNILVSVCDVCNGVVGIPSQSTEEIKKQMM